MKIFDPCETALYLRPKNNVVEHSFAYVEVMWIPCGLLAISPDVRIICQPQHTRYRYQVDSTNSVSALELVANAVQGYVLPGRSGYCKAVACL